MEAAAAGTRVHREAPDAIRRAAVRETVLAWVASRVFCWIAGTVAVLIFGAHAGPHDPFGLTAPFGSAGDTLIAPAVRWDSVWYLTIADHGYVSTTTTTFYPLYALAAKVAGAPLGSSIVGGIVVSLAALLVALYLLRRLTELELGAAAARRTVLLLAFFPTAVFFSAVYTEGLFLALSIGAIYAARTGRWAWAGVAAGLACLTRPTGFLLAVPITLLYLYGPRDDRPPDRPGGGPKPAYRVRLTAVWLLGIPVGLVAYMGYLWSEFGTPFAMAGSGSEWHQHFTLPFVAVVRAAGLAASGLLDIFQGKPPNNVYEFGFFCLAVVGTVGAFRRLPIAYAAYAAAGILLIVSFPIRGESLSSFSRYMTPLFPVVMWLAAWSSERRLYRWILAAFGIAMVVNAARFATWRFVA